MRLPRTTLVVVYLLRCHVARSIAGELTIQIRLTNGRISDADAVSYSLIYLSANRLRTDEYFDTLLFLFLFHLAYYISRYKKIRALQFTVRPQFQI